jgi:hypothetical protein
VVILDKFNDIPNALFEADNKYFSKDKTYGAAFFVRLPFYRIAQCQLPYW